MFNQADNPMNEIAVRCRSNRTYRYSPASTALLVIDMQRQFFVDDDGDGVDDMQAIIPRVANLTEQARKVGCRVIHTRETYKADLSDVSPFRQSLGYVGRPGPLGCFCIPGEPGHDFLEAVMPRPGETVIDKASFGAFHETDLDAILRDAGIDHLVVCGVTTQCCVHSTLREAVDRGYWCVTVADCCAATEPGLHDAALSLIAGEGHLFGWVCDLEDIMQGAAE